MEIDGPWFQSIYQEEQIILLKTIGIRQLKENIDFNIDDLNDSGRNILRNKINHNNFRETVTVKNIDKKQIK